MTLREAAGAARGDRRRARGRGARARRALALFEEGIAELRAASASLARRKRASSSSSKRADGVFRGRRPACLTSADVEPRGRPRARSTTRSPTFCDDRARRHRAARRRRDSLQPAGRRKAPCARCCVAAAYEAVGRHGGLPACSRRRSRSCTPTRSCTTTCRAWTTTTCAAAARRCTARSACQSATCGGPRDGAARGALRAIAAARALGLPPTAAADIVRELMRASGAGGMIGGQLLDLEAEGRRASARRARARSTARKPAR